MRENIPWLPLLCEHYFFFPFLKLNICFCGTSGNISHSCRRVTGVISQACQKHFPPFLIMKNKPHPVFFLFFLLLITSQQLFAFSGQRPAVKAPYQPVSMFPVTFTFPQIDWTEIHSPLMTKADTASQLSRLKSNALKETALWWSPARMRMNSDCFLSF